PGDGLSDDDVPGAVRDSENLGLDGAVGRDGARCGAEDRAPAPGLYRRARASLDDHRQARRTHNARGPGQRSDLGWRSHALHTGTSPARADVAAPAAASA